MHNRVEEIKKKIKYRLEGATDIIDWGDNTFSPIYPNKKKEDLLLKELHDSKEEEKEYIEHELLKVRADIFLEELNLRCYYGDLEYEELKEAKELVENSIKNEECLYKINVMREALNGINLHIYARTKANIPFFESNAYKRSDAALAFLDQAKEEFEPLQGYMSFLEFFDKKLKEEKQKPVPNLEALQIIEEARWHYLLDNDLLN